MQLYLVFFTAENATYVPETTTLQDTTADVSKVTTVSVETTTPTADVSKVTTVSVETTTPHRHLETGEIIAIVALVLTFSIAVVAMTVWRIRKRIQDKHAGGRRQGTDSESDRYYDTIMQQNNNVRSVDAYGSETHGVQGVNI